MEPIFETECRYTKQVMEIVERTIMKLWVKILFICSTVAMLRVFVAELLSQMYDMAILSFILAVAFVVYFFYMPKLRANAIYKQHERLYNGEATVKVTFYENEIVAKNVTTNATISFSYNDLIKVHEKQGIYIIIAKGIAVLVDSATIKTGSDISFPEFLQRKTLNVK